MLGGASIAENLLLKVITDDPAIFKTSIDAIVFNGYGGSFSIPEGDERAMQGMYVEFLTCLQHL